MDDSDQDFISWGSKAGIPQFILESLIEFAATPEQMQKTVDEIRPPPPIYPIDEIRAMNEGDPMGISPEKAGFLIIGTCGNGDPIAVDIGEQPGSVWYLSHEQMHENDLRSVAVKVATDIPSFDQAFAKDESFPLDYWEASKARNRSN